MIAMAISGYFAGILTAFFLNKISKSEDDNASVMVLGIPFCLLVGFATSLAVGIYLGVVK